MSPQVLIDCQVATMIPQPENPLGMIRDAAIVWQGEQLHWVGRRCDLPPQWTNAQLHEAAGAWVTPGLIDCHTHLVWGGSRSQEFRLRLNGASYEEIARAGGGIISTVSATRAASDSELQEAALKRLDSLLAEGVTTVEIKSGYGLEAETEAKCLRVARNLAKVREVSICTTFLGAHALAPEFVNQPDAYIDTVLSMLSELYNEGLVDAVDVFCERIGFSLAQTERVFKAARNLNLPIKLHAEQLSDSHGAALAARYGALSCDHLEWLNEESARAMSQAGTVAVLLPGAYYFLRETRVPPVDLLRAQGIPIALSTDCNPGSSPCNSLLLMLSMGCTLFRLTPEEALTGVTRHAARALGCTDRGILQTGARSDLALWDIDHPSDLCYVFGQHTCRGTLYGGAWRATSTLKV